MIIILYSTNGCFQKWALFFTGDKRKQNVHTFGVRKVENENLYHFLITITLKELALKFTWLSLSLFHPRRCGTRKQNWNPKLAIMERKFHFYKWMNYVEKPNSDRSNDINRCFSAWLCALCESLWSEGDWLMNTCLKETHSIMHHCFCLTLLHTKHEELI